MRSPRAPSLVPHVRSRAFLRRRLRGSFEVALVRLQLLRAVLALENVLDVETDAGADEHEGGDARHRGRVRGIGHAAASAANDGAFSGNGSVRPETWRARARSRRIEASNWRILDLGISKTMYLCVYGLRASRAATRALTSSTRRACSSHGKP